MAADPDLTSESLEIANRHLARLADSFSFFDQVMLVNPHGVIVASSDSSTIGQSLFTQFATPEMSLNWPFTAGRALPIFPNWPMI